MLGFFDTTEILGVEDENTEVQKRSKKSKFPTVLSHPQLQ